MKFPHPVRPVRPVNTASAVVMVFSLVALASITGSAPGSAQGRATVATAAGPAPVEYVVDLGRARAQRATVTMTFDLGGSLQGHSSVDLKLPVWRPGRYAILDPAGAIVDLVARDGVGTSRAVSKVDKNTWRIDSRGAGRLTVEYQLYANSLGLRTHHIDDTHAFLSGSTVFLYVAQLRSSPLLVRFQAPAAWRIASGLESHADDANTVIAPNYDVLIDSPIEIGEQDVILFEVAGKPHEIVIWPRGRRYDERVLISDFTKIIEEQLDIFGRLPYHRYVFLVHAGAGAGGGTEHLNSTIMQVPLDRLEGSTSRNDDYRGFLGLVSHEFFHTWNVKQLRPSDMVPYELDHENYSTLFWVAEGTTSYYDDLTLERAGLVKPNKYLETLSELIDGGRKRPGTAVQSLSESSFDAWIKFTKPNPDAANTTVSFYSQGALASLLMDLEIRAKTGDRASLDDVLRSLFERKPLSAGGYTRADLEQTLRSTTETDWTEFFRRYVDGTEPLPFEAAFEHVGIELYEKSEKPRKGALGPFSEDDSLAAGETDRSDDDDADTDKAEDKPVRTVADAGAIIRESGGRPVISSVRIDGAFSRAGLLPGDELVAIDRRRVSHDDWDDLIESFEPEQTVIVHFLRNQQLQTRDVVLDARRAADWSLRRVEKPTAAQELSYRSWLHQPWPEADHSKDAGDESKDAGDASKSATNHASPPLEGAGPPVALPKLLAAFEQAATLLLRR